MTYTVYADTNKGLRKVGEYAKLEIACKNGLAVLKKADRGVSYVAYIFDEKPGRVGPYSDVSKKAMGYVAVRNENMEIYKKKYKPVYDGDQFWETELKKDGRHGFLLNEDGTFGRPIVIHDGDVFYTDTRRTKKKDADWHPFGL